MKITYASLLLLIDQAVARVINGTATPEQVGELHRLQAERNRRIVAGLTE